MTLRLARQQLLGQAPRPDGLGAQVKQRSGRAIKILPLLPLSFKVLLNFVRVPLIRQPVSEGNNDGKGQGQTDQSLGSAPFSRPSSGPADECLGQSPGLDSGISKACKHTQIDA